MLIPIRYAQLNGPLFLGRNLTTDRHILDPKNKPGLTLEFDTVLRELHVTYKTNAGDEFTVLAWTAWFHVQPVNVKDMRPELELKAPPKSPVTHTAATHVGNVSITAQVEAPYNKPPKPPGPPAKFQGEAKP